MTFLIKIIRTRTTMSTQEEPQTILSQCRNFMEKELLVTKLEQVPARQVMSGRIEITEGTTPNNKIVLAWRLRHFRLEHQRLAELTNSIITPRAFRKKMKKFIAKSNCQVFTQCLMKKS